MGPVEKFALLLAVTVAITPLARRLRLAEPIAFVLGGLLLSLLPGFPAVELEPSLVFLAFLPPLLFAQAFFTSWREFCANLRPITLLAVGLVLFTTISLGFVLHWLIPALPLAVCFVFGAIVSPPDAVAVAAIARELHLPRRLVTILEGESLVNDATGLVAYRFGVAAVLSGTFSVPSASLELVKVAVGGVALGLAVAWLIARLMRLLDEAPWQVALTLVAPFAAYLPAEKLHVSGVLAVVAAGIYFGWALPERMSFASRLLGRATWRMVEFLLNGFVFVLIGLQLRTVLSGLRAEHTWAQLLLWAAVVSLAVILLRPLWIFPVTHAQRWFVPGLRRRDPTPSWRHLFVLSWAGVRGVVSLAAALALPLTLSDGREFPGRDLLLFLTFAVILATLVVQGLSFPWLVRSLGVRAAAGDGSRERDTRLALARAGLTELDRLAGEGRFNERAVRAVRDHYEERLRGLDDQLGEALGWSPEREHGVAWRHLRRAALEAERRELARRRRHNEAADELIHRLDEELDLEEAGLRR